MCFYILLSCFVFPNDPPALGWDLATIFRRLRGDMLGGYGATFSGPFVGALGPRAWVLTILASL